jgi:hypothetical protein
LYSGRKNYLCEPMQPMATISRHLRVMLTALTLLCVVALNHREVTTYTAAPEAKTAHQLHKTTAERQGTIKQKVSLEAPHAYLVLQLATFTDFLRVDFISPVTPVLNRFRLPRPVTGFFKVFLSAAIQANAP